jgi:hypothetical protein
MATVIKIQRPDSILTQLFWEYDLFKITNYIIGNSKLDYSVKGIYISCEFNGYYGTYVVCNESLMTLNRLLEKKIELSTEFLYRFICNLDTEIKF